MASLKRTAPVVKLVSNHYRKCKADIRSFAAGRKNFEEDELYSIYRRVGIINDVRDNLSFEERRIIEHELNGDLDDKYWYLKYYSTSTYRRHRIKAYDKFIEGLKF